MTSLEIALLLAEAITLAALVRIYRKHMLVRHLFTNFSDWCAHKIDEMTETASREILNLDKACAELRRHRITDDEARGAIPYAILDAKGEWEDQADYFQAMLRCNGVAPLGHNDLDPWPFNCRLAGIKHVPMPEPKRRSIRPAANKG